MARRNNVGEDDGPSRALAKAIRNIAKTVPNGLDVLMVRRPDRFGRGGDHFPFLELGYPAVRFSVAIENYHAHHQALRPGFGDTPDQLDLDRTSDAWGTSVSVRVDLGGRRIHKKTPTQTDS